MSLFGLWSASSGMRAQQTNVEISGNNVANVNTVGFQRSRGDFQDLLVERLDPSGGGLLRGDDTLHANDVGAGQNVEATKLMFEQGAVRATRSATDPSAMRPTPVRPWVATTTSHAPRLSA